MTWAIATPLQQSNIRRWLAELAHLLAVSMLAMVPGRRSRPEPRHHHALREPFIEDAAMAREMLRL